VNAIIYVRATRCELDELRREKWEKLLDDMYGFYEKMTFPDWKWKMNILIQRRGGTNLKLETSITIK
jgi:hypothetical protein